jgi:DNA-binding GntR family transcriptional regulator
MPCVREEKPLPDTQTGPALVADIVPIGQTPLRVQIADMLRRAIITGKLRPGTVLVETALAEQMSVSRAPIREAIQILESDGLIETVAYKGKRVKPLTAREVEEIYGLREMFEIMAVRRILERRRPVDALWQHCQAMEQAAASGDREALTAADEAFHRTLIRLSDHDLLLTLWNSLFLRIHQIMALRNTAQPNLVDIAANHAPIVHAIEAGDVDHAVQLISEHTRSLADFDPASIAELNV